MDKKYFIIIIVVLVFNFLVGAAGVVLASISLMKQSNVSRPMLSQNIRPGANINPNGINPGQQGNLPTQRQPNSNQNTQPPQQNRQPNRQPNNQPNKQPSVPQPNNQPNGQFGPNWNNMPGRQPFGFQGNNPQGNQPNLPQFNNRSGNQPFIPQWNNRSGNGQQPGFNNQFAGKHPLRHRFHRE